MKYVSYLWEALQGRLLQQLACCLLLLIPAAALAAPPEVIWRTHTGARSDNGAVLLGEQLYVAGAAQTAVLDPAAGTILRFLLPPDPTAISSPPISTDTGVVAGDVAGRLIAWEDGAPPAVLASLRRSLPVTALRAAGGDRIVVAGEEGCVTAFDASASKVWSHCTAGSIGDALAAADDLVYAADATGRISAWSVQRGDYRWAYEMDAPAAGPPVVSGDLLITIGVDGHLYALDRSRGALRWRTHVGNRVHSALAMGHGMVYVATETRGLVAVTVESGKAAWRASLLPTKAAPAVIDDLVVVGAPDQQLYAFDAATGRPVWRVRVDGTVLAAPLTFDDSILAITEDGVVYLLK